MRRYLLIAAIVLKSCAPDPVFAQITPKPHTAEQCMPVADFAYSVQWLKEQGISEQYAKAQFIRWLSSKNLSADTIWNLLDQFDEYWEESGGAEYVAEKVFNQCTGSLPS